VTLSLDKCLAVENWDGGGGHRGQNVFGYSADDKNWYGMFADNQGRVHVFTSGKVGTAQRNLKAQVVAPMEKGY
jgi:putative sterol carrier protein